MKFKVANANNFNFAINGRYFKRGRVVDVTGTIDLFMKYYNHPDLKMMEVNDYNPNKYTLKQLKAIADVEGINIVGLNKAEIIALLKGEEISPEEEEEEEEGDG